MVNGTYETISPTTLTDGTVVLYSETLGLDLRRLPADQMTVQFPGIATRELRLFDPQTGAKLLSYQEAEQARLEAEQVANEERQRAEQAEQKLVELMERLRLQGINLDL